MGCVGLETVTDFMEIDFLIAKFESHRPTRFFDPFQIKNTLIETACLLD